ncbi:hypothetical protein G7Z17_g12282 [Cylindrodendrum hubeiense]|uniref:Uncharacterized protein n=1 Tax=Cylindrodendrum hubeiense TaxID=595255 RepID=A0A9P5H2B5_9HYPO|nr:hypothetical protein G7Z17_g12282 [Cylindrodendrum hubeiense]
METRNKLSSAYLMARDFVAGESNYQYFGTAESYIPSLRDRLRYTNSNGKTFEKQEEVAFTDSGYASAPNFDGYSLAKPSDPQEGSSALNPSPTATNGIYNDETATLYSAGTTVVPARAENYIAVICNDIYSKVSDFVNATTWAAVSKALPDLIKAFAVNLGRESNAQVNREIMYFVHRRHREVGVRLEAMLSSDINEQPEDCRDGLDGMDLLDKMAMWQSKYDEDDIHPGEAEYFFNDAKYDDDDNDDNETEEINLSAYQSVIFDSQAYKWLLANLKKEAVLQWKESHPCILIENIRLTLIEKLPTGTISKRHAPLSHEMTFVLNWQEDIKLRLDRESEEPVAWPARELSSFVVLTGSHDDAQALTMKQYMSQTWPANGLEMCNVLQAAIRSHECQGQATG